MPALGSGCWHASEQRNEVWSVCVLCVEISYVIGMDKDHGKQMELGPERKEKIRHVVTEMRGWWSQCSKEAWLSTFGAHICKHVSHHCPLCSWEPGSHCMDCDRANIKVSEDSILTTSSGPSSHLRRLWLWRQGSWRRKHGARDETGYSNNQDRTCLPP